MTSSTINLYTQASPALAVMGEEMYLAYQGLCISPANGGLNIEWAACNGTLWKSYGPIVVTGKVDPPYNNLQTPNSILSASPALAKLSHTLYLVYQGVTPTGEIYWASRSDSGALTWDNQGPIAAYQSQGCAGTPVNLITSTSPGLGSSEAVMLVYQQATQHPNQISFLVYSTATANVCWLGLSPILSLRTPTSPTIIALGDAIYIVYQGMTGNVIYWAGWYNTSWHDLSRIVDQNKNNLLTRTSPALAVLDGTLYMAYQGTNPANQIFWASYSGSGTTWNNLGPIIDTNGDYLYTPASPALAVLNETLYLVYQASNTSPNYQLRWASYTGSGSKWDNLGAISATRSSV